MPTKDGRGNYSTAGTEITLGAGGANPVTLGAITITLPSSSATLLDTTSTQTLSNKTLDNTNTATLKDSLFTLQDNSDISKQAQFQLSGIAAGNTRVYTLPDATTTLASHADKLSDFAATTSAELAGVISDETGSGLLVFATSPTLITPDLGAATATSINGTVVPASKTIVVTTDKVVPQLLLYHIWMQVKY